MRELIAPSIAYLLQEIVIAETASEGEIEKFPRKRVYDILHRWAGLKRISERQGVGEEGLYELIDEKASHYHLSRSWRETIQNVILRIRNERIARAAS